MSYKFFRLAFLSFFALYISYGCSSTKNAYNFEDLLYKDGRPLTIRVKDDNADRKFNFYFLEANRLKMLGDKGNASLYYTEAIKIDSTCATCYFEIANLLIQNEEYKSATEYLFKAVQYDPDNEYFLYLLSKLYASNGSYTEALLSAKYLSDKYPENIEYLYHLAHLQSQVGNFGGAILSLNLMESLMGVNEVISVEKHALWLELGEKKLAERELLELIKSYPLNSDYLVYLGDFYIQQGDGARAFETYNKVLTEFPANGLVYFSLANYYYQNKDIEAFKRNLTIAFSNPNIDLESKIKRITPFFMSMEAQDNPIKIYELEEFFNLIVATHPYESSIHVLQGNFLNHINKDSLAINSYETALLIDEQQPEVWHEYLLLLFSMEHKEKFFAESEKAVKLYPENGIFAYMAGFASMFVENNSEAVSYFNKSLNLSNDNNDFKSQIYGLLGDLYFGMEEKQKSFESYDKSLELKKDNVVVLNNYAYYLSLEGLELQKAEQMISKVIEFEPTNPTYLDTYAWVLFKRGKYLEALYIIEQAISNGGDEMGAVLEHYGDILYMNGNHEGALKYWNLALESEDEITDVLKKKIEKREYFAE